MSGKCLKTTTNLPAEIEFQARKSNADPFNEVELSACFTEVGGGAEYVVPAFWAGGDMWKVRFSSPTPGRFKFCSRCSDQADAGLHGVEGEIEVVPYEGENPLLRHGPIRVAENLRYFEHFDGTPFFWLGDTWWMGLCKRLRYPDDFQTLTTDRVAKGFTVIQIVAGLYPDMPPFDERGANEAGFPWEREYARINPAYFDCADRRIAHLVQSGLVPCIVGCWGYFLPWMGIERMKQHWRNLIARWGAYPVIWCLAGEGTMPYYLSTTREEDSNFQKRGWTELALYVRTTDPYRRPLTIHPNNTARLTVEDPDVLDFEMLQTGHGDRNSIPNTVRLVTEGYNATPRMPVVNGEVCYEGIGEACRQEVQRLMFWCCLLSGAAGFTYGANGIWQVNTRQQPFGASPHGMSWGNTPWEEAYQLPGSRQLGIAKRLLERYQWWRFEPHADWVIPHAGEGNWIAPYAAGIPGEVRVIFLPWYNPNFTVTKLETDRNWRAFLFNPVDGSEVDYGPVQPDAEGNWKNPYPRLPIYQDWVLVVEATKDRG